MERNGAHKEVAGDLGEGKKSVSPEVSTKHQAPSNEQRTPNNEQRATGISNEHGITNRGISIFFVRKGDISSFPVLISMTGIFEERLIEFANLILSVCENVKLTESGKHLKSQLIRSGTSVALNYGEALSAESNRDLLHKYRIMVKELRETIINLTD